MREIPVNLGPASVLSWVRVLAVRLKTRTDTKSLAEPVVAARLVLDNLHREWQDLRDTAVAATGTINFADSIEDDVIADVARRLRVVVDGNTRSADWIRLFAEAPSTLTQGVADEEQSALADHLARTIAKDDTYKSLRDLLPELKNARQAVVAAQAERTTAERARDRAWTEVQLAERRCRELYRDTRPKLEQLFPGKKRLVDSFFYKPPAKRKKDATGSEGDDGEGEESLATGTQ